MKRRDDLRSICDAAIARVHPRTLISAGLSLDGAMLHIASRALQLDIDLDNYSRVVVLGVGKASAAMAKALEAVLGDRIDEGLVVTKYGHTEDLSKIRVIEAGHPVPDDSGLAGAQEIESLAERADEKTLVLNLISGGGSALLPAPAADISLSDIQETTRALLASGAPIQEINCIRKHISRLKGGRLAAKLHPARSVSLILSDVVGDRLDAIASGLTVPDTTTFVDARRIIEKYGIENSIPAGVVAAVDAGVAGTVSDTPKPEDPVFELSSTILLGTNAIALDAAAKRAQELGYNTVVLTSRLEGEAREVAKALAGIALDARAGVTLGSLPLCILAGGETTVTLRGDGLGGRNQELALAFLAYLEEALEAETTGTATGGTERGSPAPGIEFLSVATDGNDGPTDAAGAFASADIAQIAREQGLSTARYLNTNDAYHFHQAAGSLLRTGPTNTNVCDVQICLIP